MQRQMDAGLSGCAGVLAAAVLWALVLVGLFVAHEMGVAP